VEVTQNHANSRKQITLCSHQSECCCAPVRQHVATQNADSCGSHSSEYCGNGRGTLSLFGLLDSNATFKEHSQSGEPN
jgi:hypothetical protein